MKPTLLLCLCAAGCAMPGGKPTYSREHVAAVRAAQPDRAHTALAAAETQWPGRSLAIGRAVTDGNAITHVPLVQMVEGVPLRHRDLHGLVDGEGEVRVVGEPDTLGSLDARPALDESQAIEKARQSLARAGRTLESAHATLMWDPELKKSPPPPIEDGHFHLPPVDGFTLRWIVEAQARGPEPGVALWVFAVDAQTGEVRDEGTGRHSAFPQMVRGSFNTAYSSTRQLLNEQDGINNYALVNGLGDTFERCQLGVDVTCLSRVVAFSNHSTNEWGNGHYPIWGPMNPLDVETQGADAYASVYVAESMLSNVFGYLGWDGNGSPLHVITSYPYNDAVWSGNIVYLGYTNWIDGGPALKTILTAYGSPDVVGHEIGHGVFASQSGWLTTGDGELGGLDEATGDIIGELAEFYAQPLWAQTTCAPLGSCAKLPTAQIGKGYWLIADLEGVPRSLMDPRYAYATAEARVAERHDAAGPIDRMFYFLTAGVQQSGSPTGGSTNVLGPARTSLLLSRGMSGVGLEKAGRLWLNALAYLQSGVGFDQARLATLQAAVDLDSQHLPYGPDYKSVEDAFAAVGIGVRADRDGPVVNFTTTQISTSQLTITVDMTDPSGIARGTVTVGPAVVSCNGHCQFNVDPRLLHDGSNTAVIEATDNRRNTVEVSKPFNVDLTGPSITALTETSPTPGNARSFAISTNDPSGLKSVTLSDGSVALTTPLSSTSFSGTLSFDVAHLPHGTATLTAQVLDKYGNPSTRSLTVSVDHLAPDLCKLSYDTVDRVFFGAVEVRDPDSGLAKLDLSIDGTSVASQTWTPPVHGAYWTPSTPQALALGLHHGSATCVDAAGNVTHGDLDFTVSLGPTMTFNASSPTAGRVSATMQFADPDGVTMAWLQVLCPGIDGHPLAAKYYSTPYPTSDTLSGSVDLDYSGTCQVQAFAIDRYNAKTLKTLSVTVSTPPPPPPPPTGCNQTFSASGVNEGGDYTIDVGGSSGLTTGHFVLDYDTLTIPDELVLTCADGGTVGGHQAYDTGCIATDGTVSPQLFFGCLSSRIRVRIRQDCLGTGARTEWSFKVHCATP